MNRRVKIHGWIEMEIEDEGLSDYAAWQEIEMLLDAAREHIRGSTRVRVSDYRGCVSSEDTGKGEQVTWRMSRSEPWLKMMRDAYHDDDQ